MRNAFDGPAETDPSTVRLQVSWLNLLGLSTEPVLLDVANGMYVTMINMSHSVSCSTGGAQQS